MLSAFPSFNNSSNQGKDLFSELEDKEEDEVGTASLLLGITSGGVVSLLCGCVWLSSSEQKTSKLLAGDCTATSKKKNSISQYQ